MTLTHQFGRFELRPATRQLLVDRQPATLGARAFDLLLALIERRDQLVTKDALLDLVWPGLVVEENNLQVQVSALRKLLGPDAIATVPGRGYRFTLEPTQVEASLPTPARAASHNLPAPVSSFVGRERELADLRAMLATHRLVTLTGVGGIGKTRLALQLAASTADAYADGAWFVDLAPVFDPRLVANAVASALGVKEEAGQPIIETLQRFVADRTLLLVLDNCEHLLLASAQLARDLLGTGPRAVIVATSREPLHVSGEAVFPLATLAAPDVERKLELDAMRGYAAVRLFVDRAIDARPDFALTAQDAQDVVRICRDLDGIPLALELAAARVRTMPVETIARHLPSRFALLKGGDPTALPRQRTLRATIDWSYDLLTSEEQSLLRRLSMFAGNFALDAAERVGAGDDVAPIDVLDALGHLVEKSLVAFDAQTGRYRLLETVRQYAGERLAQAGEEATIRDRHLSYYVALAERSQGELEGPGQVAWAARLNAERENILLAFEHARTAPGSGAAGLAMVYGFKQWFGWTQPGLWYRVILEALAHPEAQQEDVARSRAMYVACQACGLTGRFDEGYALAQRSVAIARSCGDPQVLAEALFRLGIVANDLDRGAEAHEHFLEGLGLARHVGDQVLLTMLSGGLGELHSRQGQLETAEPHYLESLRACGGDPAHTLWALSALARNAITLRGAAKALRYLRAAVATGAARHSILTTLPILLYGAGLAALREEWALALRLSGAAESLQELHGYGDDPIDAQFHAHAIAPARAALDATAADTALAAGRALSADEALREAEAWLDALPSDESPP